MSIPWGRKTTKCKVEETKEDTRLAQRQLPREVLTDSWFEKLSLPRYSVHICRSQSMHYAWSSRGCLIFLTAVIFFFFFNSQTALILLARLPVDRLGPLPSGGQDVPGSGRSSICSCAYLALYAILNGTHRYGSGAYIHYDRVNPTSQDKAMEQLLHALQLDTNREDLSGRN